MSLSPLQRYEQAVSTDDFTRDEQQFQAMSYLDEIYHQLINSAEQKKGFFSFLKAKPTAPKGLYMWGGVGRGKTWMMDMFYESLTIDRKMRLHFHHFMQRVHKELHKLQGESDPLEKVADIIYEEAVIICFDEFFVSNVSDAMILGDLFTMLFNRGITLVATSNIEPSGLYKDGLHRNRFLPAIAEVERYTAVMNIDSGIDYRLRVLQQAELYESPMTKANHHCSPTVLPAYLTIKKSVMSLLLSMVVKSKSMRVPKIFCFVISVTYAWSHVLPLILSKLPNSSARCWSTRYQH